MSARLPAILPTSGSDTFLSVLKEHGFNGIHRTAPPATLQINLGKICNQACHHCHVEAGPKRTESMTRETAQRIVTLLVASECVTTVDITGGAPEINRNFTFLVEESRGLGRHVIDRCNLTILLETGYEYLAAFLAAHKVEVIASLPCYTPANVDAQRGRGVFEKSIHALQLLNRLGYGIDAQLSLNLVFNPGGASLPPPQDVLAADYRERLRVDWGIEFNRLYTLTNMPIRRFAEYLERTGKAEQYRQLLEEKFNPDTVPGLMCRNLISIGFDGQIFDCDFNQMLELRRKPEASIWDIDSFDTLIGEVVTGDHCFGCTAGAGSSCGGALNPLNR